MFELGVNNAGKTNVVQHDAIRKKIEKWVRRLCLKYSLIGTIKLM